MMSSGKKGQGLPLLTPNAAISHVEAEALN